MRCIQAAEFSGFFCQLGNLGCRCVEARRVHQPGTDADGTRLHGFTNPCPHAGDLVVIGSAANIALHRFGAERIVAAQHRRIDCRWCFLEGFCVIRKGRKAILALVAQQRHRYRHFPVISRQERCQADPAIAGDHRCHTLCHLAGHGRVIKQNPVVMGMAVDEPGGDDVAFGINALSGLDSGYITDRRDPVGADRQSASEARLPRAVNDDSIVDHDIRIFTHIFMSLFLAVKAGSYPPHPECLLRPSPRS